MLNNSLRVCHLLKILGDFVDDLASDGFGLSERQLAYERFVFKKQCNSVNSDIQRTTSYLTDVEICLDVTNLGPSQQNLLPLAGLEFAALRDFGLYLFLRLGNF